MHRTLYRPWALLLGGLLLALLASGRPEPSQAQIPAPTSTPLIVPTGSKTRLQMTTKKAIKLVNNTKDNVLGIKKVEGDPTSIELTGQDAGITHLELTDVDGKMESYDVIVQVDVEFLRIQLRRMVPTGNIDPIPISNNIVILRGTVNHIEDIARASGAAATALPGVQIVTDLRVAGVQQVQLCVTVAAVSRTKLRQMTFDFFTNSENFFLGSTIGQAVVQPSLVGVGSAFLNATRTGQTLSGNPGLNTNILFGVLHNRWGFLGFLEALKTEGVIKEQADSTLTTMSGRPASFLAGGEQAVPVPAGLGQVGVQFEEFGTRVNFIPIVLGNGKIRLEVEPEISELSAANGTTIQGTTVPGRSTNRVNTTVELEDGQTFVIGGLVQNLVTAETIKTPVLGDLPFLGAAFSSKSYQEDEEELVILVTPHLVDAEDCAQAPKMLPGYETRSPDDFELFLEGILEAPRGPRQVFEDGRYKPAYKNSPTASLFPCAGQQGWFAGQNGACSSGCNGANAAGTSVPQPTGTATAPVPGGQPAAEAAKPMLMPLGPSDAAKDVPGPSPAPVPPAADKPAAPSGSLPSDLPPAVGSPGDEPK
jgi:pilus assembly protein CpaC